MRRSSCVYKEQYAETFLYQCQTAWRTAGKGTLLGVQFDALFTDSLYFEIGKSAIFCAQQLKDAFRDKGYTFYLDSPTNQIFIVLENEKMAELQKEVVFGRWEKGRRKPHRSQICDKLGDKKKRM